VLVKLHGDASHESSAWRSWRGCREPGTQRTANCPGLQESRSQCDALYLEVGTRKVHDRVDYPTSTCSTSRMRKVPIYPQIGRTLSAAEVIRGVATAARRRATQLRLSHDTVNFKLDIEPTASRS